MNSFADSSSYTHEEMNNVSKQGESSTTSSRRVRSSRKAKNMEHSKLTREASGPTPVRFSALRMAQAAILPEEDTHTLSHTSTSVLQPIRMEQDLAMQYDQKNTIKNKKLNHKRKEQEQGAPLHAEDAEPKRKVGRPKGSGSKAKPKAELVELQAESASFSKEEQLDVEVTEVKRERKRSSRGKSKLTRLPSSTVIGGEVEGETFVAQEEGSQKKADALSQASSSKSLTRSASSVLAKPAVPSAVFSYPQEEKEAPTPTSTLASIPRKRGRPRRNSQSTSKETRNSQQDASLSKASIFPSPTKSSAQASVQDPDHSLGKGSKEVVIMPVQQEARLSQIRPVFSRRGRRSAAPKENPSLRERILRGETDELLPMQDEALLEDVLLLEVDRKEGVGLQNPVGPNISEEKGLNTNIGNKERAGRTLEDRASGTKQNFAYKSSLTEESTLAVETQETEELQIEGEKNTEACSGILDIQADGYGLLRVENYLPSVKDIYVNPHIIKKYRLRQGDHLQGIKRLVRETDRYPALVYVNAINDIPTSEWSPRKQFEHLVPVYPKERLHLEYLPSELSTRIIDLFSPLGKGQRGLIVSPPKAGKTILLKKIANAINRNHPEAYLMVLLIDERPEEVTDIQRSVQGEVLYSTFDRQPENHMRLAELCLERATRLVEAGKDVVILLDSLTRLARAYNLTVNPSGRSLSGGLDPAALYGPKRFLGAARKIENGGSLTILASALVETGSRMDDVIFEEFKGTGNMEIFLDRKLAEKRIFPAIDLQRSGTRREELLLQKEQLKNIWAIRKAFAQTDNAVVTETVLQMLQKTPSNASFLDAMKEMFLNKEE